MSSKRSKRIPMDVMENVEDWPAHALGRALGTSSITVSNDRLQVLSDGEKNIPNLVPKPKFLSYLEEQIRLNLKPLRSNDVDGRFQVFKEAFHLIIAAFKTHGPILAQISREYETVLQHYKTEVQKLRPAQEYLWTIKQECDQRVLELKNQEKPELESLRKEITRLKAQVSAKNEEQVSMQVEIGKLKASLEEEHGKCRHEADAKNLLVIELNDMQNHYSELQKVTQQAREEATNVGDPALLRIALDQARKALSEAQFELTKIKADYVDVIPKREYEILMQSNQMLEEKIVEQEAKFAELTEEMKHCESELSGMIEQRDEYKRALQQLNRASTPRPQWDEAGRSLPCGLSKWNEETHGMSSQQKMQYLIRIMAKTTKDDGDGPKQLESKASSRTDCNEEEESLDVTVEGRTETIIGGIF